MFVVERQQDLSSLMINSLIDLILDMEFQNGGKDNKYRGYNTSEIDGIPSLVYVDMYSENNFKDIYFDMIFAEFELVICYYHDISN